MSGGVSHVDTFDPKPALDKYAGQPLDGKGGDVIVRQGHPGPLMPSPFAFKKYGQSGMDVSDLFPNVGGQVDEIAFMRSVYGQSNDHVQATYEMQTGQIRMGFPSVGSWVTYGLGSENASLPAFVVIHDARGGPLGGVNTGARASCRRPIRARCSARRGDPIVDLKPPAERHAGAAARPARPAGEAERARHAAVSRAIRDLAARISSYELAYRMQGCAPEAVDIGQRVGGDARSCTGWTRRSPSRSAGSA